MTPTEDHEKLDSASANLEAPRGPQPVETEPEVPVWMQRIFVIVYVVFCLQLGIMLIVLPWSDPWTNNNLLAHWPALKHLWEHGFFRGAISGLGFLDLWLGISEAVSYRDRR